MIQSTRAAGARVAFYGRAACAEDAYTSIQRQLRTVAAALPAEARIVGYFADVAPWNGLRGTYLPTDTWYLAGHPVDGGLIDLLDHAGRPHRSFDVVACADDVRLSRRLVDYERIEDDLAEHGVHIVTADDLMITALQPPDIHRATQKHPQRSAWDAVTAETTHLSRKTNDHLRIEGWHIGPVPYGYTAENITVEGTRRRRLVPDSLRTQHVRDIFTWRVTERFAATTITRRLNADPTRPGVALPGTKNSPRPWSAPLVRAILANPVYTGHLVTNRIGPDQRLRPLDEWVWSPTPVHEPIITRDIFLSAQQLGARESASSVGRGRVRQGNKRGSR